MNKFIPTNDYVFKRIFGHKGNEEITKNFAEAVTGEKYTNISLEENPILDRELENGKTGILDVRLKADDQNIDIEMQVVKSQNIIDRALWYWSKMFQESIIRGDDYSKTKRTICIIITDFLIDDLRDIKDFHTKWNLYDKFQKNRALTNKIEIHIIELGKLESIEKLNEDLVYWCTFIKNPERIGDSIMNENKYIKEAKDVLDIINADADEARRAEIREKAIMDEKWIRNSAIKEGKAEGKAIGLAEGKAEGRAEGRAEEKKKKKTEEKQEIAKKMKSKGFDINEISELTGLSVEEIENIK